MRRVAVGDAVIVPACRVEAFAAVEVAYPLHTLGQVARAVVVQAGHVLDLILEVDVEGAQVGFVLAGGARAHREGLDGLVVMIHGGSLRGAVHHDAVFALLLHGFEVLHITVHRNGGALAVFERFADLRRKRLHVLDLHAVHAFDDGGQHFAAVVDGVFLVDRVLVELGWDLLLHVVGDGVVIVGQRKRAVFEVGVGFQP